MVLAHIGPLLGRQGSWHSSKIAENPVPIIARGMIPTPDLCSSGWPRTHGNSSVSDFQVLEFQAKAAVSSSCLSFPSYSSGSPTRVPAECIARAFGHSAPWISLGLAYISDVLRQRKWGTRYMETSLTPEKVRVADEGRLIST